MSSRTYVVILFFWALLTVVTPMLVRLSASANLHATFDGKRKEGVNKLLLPRKGLITAIVSPSPSPSPSPTLGSAEEDVFSDKLRNYDGQRRKRVLKTNN